MPKITLAQIKKLQFREFNEGETYEYSYGDYITYAGTFTLVVYSGESPKGYCSITIIDNTSPGDSDEKDEFYIENVKLAELNLN